MEEGMPASSYTSAGAAAGVYLGGAGEDALINGKYVDLAA
jgi:hypothetical protein